MLFAASALRFGVLSRVYPVHGWSARSASIVMRTTLSIDGAGSLGGAPASTTALATGGDAAVAGVGATRVGVDTAEVDARCSRHDASARIKAAWSDRLA